MNSNHLDLKKIAGMLRDRNRLTAGIAVCIFLSLFTASVSRAETLPDANNEITDLTQLSMEELMNIEVATVYGASRFEQKVTEAPSSISIITADEIKKYGYRTLADILRSVKGFFTTYDRNYHYLGVRGFGQPGDYNTRVLLLVDGHRINDNIYNQAPIGTDFVLDVDLIERVEVIPGPGSSLYGSNAFFGVISVITRKGAASKGAELSGEAASLDTYKGRVTYGNRFQNGLEMMLSATVYDSKGRKRLFFREFDDPSTNDGVAENADGDRFHSIFGNFTFGDFTLQGAYINREKHIPTASFETVFNDPDTKTVDGDAFVDLKYRHDFDQSSVTARIFYDRYYYAGTYKYDFADPGNPPDLDVNKDDARGNWWGSEIQYLMRIFEKHKIILGAEYRNNFRQDQWNYDRVANLDDKEKSEFWALYIEDEFAILHNLILNAGVRYDHYTISDESTNPRLALIYSPFEKTAIKLLCGTAFRAPNIYELYYNDGDITQKSNPDLKPETIKTYELVYEQYMGKYLKASASGYQYIIKELITQQTDPADGLIVFNNAGEIKAHGFELELEGKWKDGLQTRANYSYQYAKDKETDRVLTNSPKHLAKFNMIVPLIDEKLFSGIEAQYMGARKTLAGDSIDGLFIANATLFSRNMIKGVEISGSVYNLFDKKYGDPGSEEHVQDIIVQDGRIFRVKLTYQF